MSEGKWIRMRGRARRSRRRRDECTEIVCRRLPLDAGVADQSLGDLLRIDRRARRECPGDEQSRYADAKTAAEHFEEQEAAGVIEFGEESAQTLGDDAARQ